MRLAFDQCQLIHSFGLLKGNSDYFNPVSYKTINFIFLPFNLVVKSATAVFVLLNSVLVDAKFVFVVPKSFEVAEPFHSIKI
jgi:hypothetical protein